MAGKAVSERFTICVLLYGDHPRLAARCLESIYPLWEGGAEVRVAACQVSAPTLGFLHNYVAQTPGSLRARLHVLLEEGNPGKYPMMRRLFAVAPLRELVMWFDDDSWVTAAQPLAWLEEAARKLDGVAMVGSPYTIRLFGQQHLWIQRQPWFTGRAVTRGKRVEFLTGGWWILRRDVIERFDLPLAEAHHRGGDVMTGQLLYQQGLRWRRFNRGVAINASDDGRESQSPRRGLSQHAPILGVDG